MNNCAKWIVVVLILAGSTVQAQQEPTYTQYMFNTQTVNPAYAGSWETMGFMVLAREQWTGIENAPSTQTFTFQTLHKNEKVGLGLNIINDKFGLEKRLSVFGDYSYLLQVNDAGLKLRLGLKAGFSSYSNNLSSYDVIDNDPRFMGSSKYSFMPNFGVGAFLYENRYYVGISVPKMIQNEFKNEENYSTQAELRHFFLMAGYVFELSENLKFKPTLLGKVTAGAPLQMDVTTNFLIADRVWLGAMYRTGDSFGLLAQWIINNKLRFGYSVDFATSQLKSYQSGTHEVMISYEIGGNRNQSIASRLF